MVTKERIHGLICGSNPANPSEHAQSGKQESGNEIIKGADCRNEEEELVSRHVSVALLAVVFVQGVQESAFYQGTGPDHARRPNEILADKAGI